MHVLYDLDCGQVHWDGWFDQVDERLIVFRTIELDLDKGFCLRVLK